MNLSLYIFKNFDMKSYLDGNFIRFAVIDLDTSDTYPVNFICSLPKNINNKSKKQSKFSRMFGEKSKSVAKQLLTKALKSESDLEITKTIRNRLKLLGPKPMFKVNCRVCKEPFEVDKRKFKRHKVCSECFQRRYEKTN